MAEKKLSKKALNKSFRNWFYGHLTCFSQEHMQTFGYLCAMLPLVEELYDTREEQTEALKTYSAFFNTEPQLGTVIVGMTAGLEEAKANGEDIDGEMINGIRAGLMGPVAGIGDSLLVGTLIPILLGVALGMSSGGSPLGAIFYIIAYNVILTLGMRLLYFKGYELGGKAVEMIVGEKANAIRESIIMLGTVVIGAVAASWISITTPLVLPGDISLQKDVLDTIFPKILPLGTVMLCYWLMSKKKMAPTTVMLVLVGIALVGVFIVFFYPLVAYFYIFTLTISYFHFSGRRAFARRPPYRKGVFPMMNKTALLHEAKQQQQALRQLSLWKRIAMLLSSCAAVLAWWGIAGSGLRFAGGVCGVVIALACAVCAAVIGRGIRNGNRNVANILSAAEQA